MPVEDHLLHTPDAHGAAKAEQVRLKAIEFEAVLDAMVPTGRELALAKTKLEEARMWAIKGIVTQYPAQPLHPNAYNPSILMGVPNPTTDETCPDFMEKRRQAGLHLPVDEADIAVMGVSTLDPMLGDSPTLTSWDDPN